MPTPKRIEPPPPRIQIVQPAPMIDCGRYPSKRTVGESVAVSADIFSDGHDVLRAVVKSCPPGGEGWRERPMHRIDAHIDGDRWAGEFEVTELGRWSWTIEAWVDAFASWRDELQRKIDAGQTDLSGELSEGVVLLEEVAERATGEDGARVEQALTRLRDDGIPGEARDEAALDPELFEVVERHPDRSRSTVMEERLYVDVDPERARFGAWYELFPRSWGGLRGVA
jgi:starch synthase (maltosyl-transferring)